MKNIEYEFEERVKEHEGLRLTPYKDSKGILTIGWGHNLTYGISERVAELIFDEDIKNAKQLVAGNLSWAVFGINTQAYYVLVELAFWIGTGLFGFEKMLMALKNKDYVTAADELKDSQLFREYPDRTNSLIKIFTNS